MEGAVVIPRRRRKADGEPMRRGRRSRIRLWMDGGRDGLDRGEGCVIVEWMWRDEMPNDAIGSIRVEGRLSWERARAPRTG